MVRYPRARLNGSAMLKALVLLSPVSKIAAQVSAFDAGLFCCFVRLGLPGPTQIGLRAPLPPAATWSSFRQSVPLRLSSASQPWVAIQWFICSRSLLFGVIKRLVRAGVC